MPVTTAADNSLTFHVNHLPGRHDSHKILGHIFLFYLFIYFFFWDAICYLLNFDHKILIYSHSLPSADSRRAVVKLLVNRLED